VAWESYRDGGIAVGAVLTDAAGAVLGEGRNQRFAGRTRGLLAHAELGALAALAPGKDRARDSVLYTTLSPCPMCLGAIVVARIGHVHVGAIDPTWLGIERLPDLNDEVQRRWPQIHGPLPGPIGAWLTIAPCLNTSGALLRAMERISPRNAALARAVNRRYQQSTHRPGTAAQALEDAWDLLTDSTR
jgi:tRNA(Arg) A34 adenosine deaminase TadA